MPNLQYWEEKIKKKRKQTPWKEYLLKIASWYPMVLYKNNSTISRFPQTERIFGVCTKDIFETERMEFTNFGVFNDSNISFIQSFKRLLNTIHLPSLIHFAQNENCDFSDVVMNCKNAYLSFTIIVGCENVLYSFSIKDSCVNILNSVMVWDNSENTYMSTAITKGYNIFYSRFIDNSNNIWFSSNLVGCSECLFCDGLENVSYHIHNKEYPKKDYDLYKKKFLKEKQLFPGYFKHVLDTPGANKTSENVKGSGIAESENIENGYFVYHVQNGRNIVLGGSANGNENLFDTFSVGSPNGNNYFAIVGAGGGDNFYASCHIVNCSNIYYSYFLESCSFCLGCIGLKNKSYCILNKQYSKEEWYELADKIFQQMEREGILGDFFPGELNPFYFNDTAAYLIDDSFTKEEVERDGYMWRDSEIKVDIPEGAEIVKISELNTFQGFDENGVWTLNPEILKKVIVDEKGNSYRVVKMEYDFLVKYGLPLPEIHWLDRIKMGFRF